MAGRPGCLGRNDRKQKSGGATPRCAMSSRSQLEKCKISSSKQVRKPRDYSVSNR